MCGVNAYLIQEKIKQKEYITVAWIQAEYKLDYKEAKEFLFFLKTRGWVEPLPVGIQYPVIQSNLHLRKLVRDEVDGLVDDITADCISALMCIQKKGELGASYSEVEAAVQGEEDTIEAIKILNNHKLICLVNEQYFATVSRKTISVLLDVVKGKRQNETQKRLSGKSKDNSSLGKLFDVLFDNQ